MLIYIISAAAIISCVLTVILCRIYVKRAFNSIDAALDRVLKKEPGTYIETTTGEDRISKLTHKANRIMDMFVSEAAQTKEEKETIQSFISDMSHQMKTPLSAISMYSQLLLENHDLPDSGSISQEEQKEFLSRIKSSTEKLQWMMESLIKMSRLEVGAIQLTPVPANIRQTISEATGSVQAAAYDKRISIETADIEDKDLLHDKKWTMEAIVNVLENAIKYSEPGSEITVCVEQMPIYTKIVITDHGIGIEKSDWNLIFKRFYRGKNAADKPGAGLGLYLAALIMEKQGGYIMVDSVPGQFTSFSLFLQNCQK